MSSTENITVIELGSDGDKWLVTGTSDAHSADEAVRQFVEQQTGETIEAMLDADDLVEFEIVRRTDFVWSIEPVEGSDETLRWLGFGPGYPAELERFAGFKVMA